MEKLLKILVGLLLFMVCSVNSADSNTAVDLRTLGRMMCRKRKVFYTEGYREFCEVARRELWGGANPKKDEKRLCQFWDFIWGDRLFLT